MDHSGDARLVWRAAGSRELGNLVALAGDLSGVFLGTQQRLAALAGAVRAAFPSAVPFHSQTPLVELGDSAPLPLARRRFSLCRSDGGESRPTNIRTC